jgi:hypothetical protein
MTTQRSIPSATRGHTLVIQAVIVLVIAAVIVVPIYFLTHAASKRQGRLIDQALAVSTRANQAMTELKRGYDAIAATRRLKHSERIKREYEEEFQKLFRDLYQARKSLEADDGKYTIDDLVAIKREFEEYDRRVSGHRDRIMKLVRLRDRAENAIQRARSYQQAIHLVRDNARFELNKFVIPQLEEADRQLGTAMNFAISGIQQFPEDLRGEKTPALILTGIAQIGRVIDDVDGLFRRVDGAADVKMTMPDRERITLETYIRRFLEESARDRAEEEKTAAEGAGQP